MEVKGELVLCAPLSSADPEHIPGALCSSLTAWKSHPGTLTLLLEWTRTLHREPFLVQEKSDVLHSWKQTSQYLACSLYNAQTLEPLICTLMSPPPQIQTGSASDLSELRRKVATSLLGVLEPFLLQLRHKSPLFMEEHENNQEDGSCPSAVRGKWRARSWGNRVSREGGKISYCMSTQQSRMEPSQRIMWIYSC